MKACYYFSDSGSKMCEGVVIHSLRQADITLSHFNTDLQSGYGLLFFSEVTPALYEGLWKLSNAGRERVLAIAVSKSSPPEYDAWRLLQGGASDVLTWDHAAASPAATVAARLERWQKVDELLQSPVVCNNLIGKSTAYLSVLRQIVEIAHFTNANIIVSGESGTGKELVARLIHTLDDRPQKGELVIVDCTTIVPELSGSEFFGHERGAFTGAATARDGAFALANRGTLFLDEVGELPLPLQAQLLRVVQEHTYKRVGGNTWQNTEFRLVCATNRNLPEEVRNGKFRHDLYYRIANWMFTLPPLRDRPEDIIHLVRHFMKQHHPEEHIPAFDDSVRDYLLGREYPGNVRDLGQLVARIIQKHVGRGPVTAGDMPVDERPADELHQAEWRNGSFENAIRFAISLGVNMKDIRRSASDILIRGSGSLAGFANQVAGPGSQFSNPVGFKEAACIR